MRLSTTHYDHIMIHKYVDVWAIKLLKLNPCGSSAFVALYFCYRSDFDIVISKTSP